MPTKKASALTEYDKKRHFGSTPEPSGEQGRSTAAKRRGAQRLHFVVQQHHATRMHWDFRLEANGVLASWAVPKGPSMRPADRHLAVHVEDHPYDYRTFEGIIPAGNYGAGSVIVWDEGTYKLAEGTDPVAEVAKGKIKFVLAGKKLRGLFTLVKIRGDKYGDQDAWLLIKDHDEFADPNWSLVKEDKSVKSGRTVDEVARDGHAKKWISDRPASRGVGRRLRSAPKISLPSDISPMLATLVDAPFDSDDWLFEIKWDGYRATCTVDADGQVTLRSRNDKDLLEKFPELRSLGQAFSSLPLIADGEIVSLDEHGRSSFQRLQNRMESRKPKAEKYEGTVTFVAFDLLFGNGRDLRSEPLEERKGLLETLIVPGHGAMYSKHIIGRGKELYALAKREHLEGIIGKRRDSVYQGRRSRDWVKIKALQEQEFVVGGWTEPRGSRSRFGALLLGVHQGADFVYVGLVGTGFDAARLDSIFKKLKPLETTSSPFKTVPRSNPPAHFVTPKLVAEVRFTEWTDEGLLRQPVFLGLREDKPAKDVVREAQLSRKAVV